MKFRPLCQWTGIPDPGTRSIEAVVNGQTLDLIVVNWAGQARVYVNSCPHTGVNLNWLPDEFLTVDQRLLQCGMHGALFRPEDGLCVHGPCLGERLDLLECEIIDGEVCLLLNDHEADEAVEYPPLSDEK